MELQKRKLMDKDAPNKSTAIINGSSSNILNWDDVRFPWTYKTYKQMLGNHWTTDEINMNPDAQQFPDLSEDEQESYQKVIGLLAFLDSVQTDFSLRVTDYLTDSSFVALMSRLSFEEVLHQQSYSYSLSSIVTKEKQDEIFNYWRTEPALVERNQFIIDGYEQFTDKNSPETFLRAIVYDVCLEGLFFYSGFAFFYNLARNGKMVATQTMIGYINRDEHIHVRIFTEIFKTVLIDYPEYKTEELEKFVHATIKRAAELEIAWGQEIIGDKFDGLSMYDLESYIKFYANVRSKQLGYGDVFEGYNKNPLRWITAFENTNKGKTDFFEQKPRQYSKMSRENGLNDL